MDVEISSFSSVLPDSGFCYGYLYFCHYCLTSCSIDQVERSETPESAAPEKNSNENETEIDFDFVNQGYGCLYSA